MMPGVIKLRLEIQRPWLKVGPFWATLAGSIAAGGFSLQPRNWLLLVLVLFLTEGVMGNWWDHLLRLAGWKTSDRAEAIEMVPPPPYALPGSLAWKLWESLNRFAIWWMHIFWPQEGTDFLGLLVFTGLTWVLGIILGRITYPLIAGAQALGILGAMVARRGGDYLPAKGLFAVTFPWLLGCITFGAVTPIAFMVALLFGLMLWGIEERKAGKTAWLLLGTPQLALVLLLWWAKQPLLAAMVACIGLGLFFLLVGEREVKRLHLPLILSMLLSALALALPG